MLHAPISWGELLDKISILEIKAAKFSDADKLINVRNELAALIAVRDANWPSDAVLDDDITALKQVNEALWRIEDDIRECERRDSFDERFIELARAVYRTNDRRAAIKRRLNDALGSALIEEKSYATY